MLQVQISLTFPTDFNWYLRMVRNWTKNRQRELTHLARSQDRDERQSVAALQRGAFDRGQERKSVGINLRCCVCRHEGHLVVDLARVRRPINLRCSACGHKQRI